MTTVLRELIEAYNASGRCAFYHSRKQTVSLSGHKAIPVKDAIAKMTAVLEKEKA